MRSFMLPGATVGLSVELNYWELTEHTLAVLDTIRSLLDGDLTCQCGIRFETPRQLAAHRLSHRVPTECPRCHVMVKPSQVARHAAACQQINGPGTSAEQPMPDEEGRIEIPADVGRMIDVDRLRIAAAEAI